MKVSRHYKKERYKREKLIRRKINGDGQVIDSFIIDRGHKNGIECHKITENGVVLIYNVNSEKLVTKLVCRIDQLEKYYGSVGREAPLWLASLCQWHESLNYNMY